MQLVCQLVQEGGTLADDRDVGHAENPGVDRDTDSRFTVK